MISVLTGQDDARLLVRVDTATIADAWKKQLGIDVGAAFRDIGYLEYWECSKSGFRWYEPGAAAGGAELYEQLEKFDWYYMRDKWEFDVALGLLKGADSVLEVGVGEGNFLEKAKRVGLNIQGVELNPKGAARARARGFKIHECPLEELAGENVFDAVCSFQVLEHVAAPRQFIEAMLKMLRPGGKLVLSVPNGDVMRKIDPRNSDLLNQPPHHMGHWTEGVFRSLEGLMPLKIQSIHKEPMQSYHVGWMVNGYLRGQLDFLGETLPRILINRYTASPLHLAMRLGLRKLFPGHTLLVEYRYQP